MKDRFWLVGLYIVIKHFTTKGRGANSLASQPLFLRGGARGGGREKESGDLSQHFVFSAGM